MKCNYLMVACATLLLALLGSLVAGSFVTYAPTVSATDIQNWYLERIVRHAGAAAVLQLLMLGACLWRLRWRVIDPASRSLES
jgi:hypothetical protein